MKSGLFDLFSSYGVYLLALNNDTPAIEAAPAGGETPQEVVPEATAEGVSLFAQFFANPLNLILISGILFIMLVLRPQQRQMKEMQQALASLKKNDRVITASGIHGTVVQASADDPVVTLRIDDNSGARMTINRDSINKIVNPDSKD